MFIPFFRKMKKQIFAFAFSALCGLLLGAFIGYKIVDPVRATLIAFADMRVSAYHVVSALSTFFTGAIRLSVKV